MREIRGWNVGQVVTMVEMDLNTANIMEEIGSPGDANLPCIYNGLNLQSQSGTGGSIVTFNPGVCRCRDLLTSIYTYLPSNAYGNSYPCFIDISVLDSNHVITLSTGITSGYIVATFTINPTTPGQLNYVITGELQQITTGAYDPAIHVRLCSFVYALSVFTLDFTPGTSRDCDMTGAGGVQWNYQNSVLEINTPPSQGGSNPVNFPNGISTNSFVAPTQQIFTSGSGTYTSPLSPRIPRYIHVQMWGGGGGGSGSGFNTRGGAGSDGGGTSFDGQGAAEGLGAPNDAPGLGGSAVSGAGLFIDGQNGSLGITFDTQLAGGHLSPVFPGGNGGNSSYLVGGGAGSTPFPLRIGNDGTPGSGGGGSGASIDGTIVGTASGIYYAGHGGGGAVYREFFGSPGNYSYTVGAGGAAGAAGPSGYIGGAGGSGKIIVTEYYQ